MPKFGLTLSNRDVVTGESTLADLLMLARRADADEAWSSVWVGDSLFAKPRLDALTLLGGLATATSRVRLGPACFASTPLRPALLLAYQWASLDVLSGGRTIFVACQGQGVPGGGHFAREFAAMGVDPGDRMRRMEEAVEILRLTSTGKPVSYAGDHNRFEDVVVSPAPVQQPLPIWIATNPHPDHPRHRERALRRVARLADGWMTTRHGPEVVADYLSELRGYADEIGRPLGPDYEVALYHNIVVDDDEARGLARAREFLEGYYMTTYTREQLTERVSFGSPARCIENLRAFAAAGVTTITLRLIGDDPARQYARVTEEVLPAFA